VIGSARRNGSDCVSASVNRIVSGNDSYCPWRPSGCAIACLDVDWDFSFVHHDSCFCCDSCCDPANAASCLDCATSFHPSADRAVLSTQAEALRIHRETLLDTVPVVHRIREVGDRGSRVEESDDGGGREIDDDVSCDCANESAIGLGSDACSSYLRRS
jgi:hypothetical protein